MIVYTHLGISFSILTSLPCVFKTIIFPINENKHNKLTENKYKAIYYLYFKYI